jgi:hypothetical protein
MKGRDDMREDPHPTIVLDQAERYVPLRSFLDRRRWPMT